MAAAMEWLRWGEHERGWKRSTLVDRRSLLRCHLLPEFGALPINQITTRRVEAWKIRWLAEHDARRELPAMGGSGRTRGTPRLSLFKADCESGGLSGNAARLGVGARPCCAYARRWDRTG
jgi:hypothetical protein